MNRSDMKIVMFSINPLYPDRVTGGASKNLYSIARYLGSLGHEVSILCAQTENTLPQFSLSEGVTVRANLPFSLPFPQPYAVSGADLALITARISEALQDADRFYIHDGEWLIPGVYDEIPTIASFRDNIYPESVLGTFIGKADDVICVSAYSKSVIEHSAGQFYPDLKDRIHWVNNGIDVNQFHPRSHGKLIKELGLDPDHEFILLHPHRPEPGKGLPETIRVVDQLIHRHGINNLRVLIPEWIDEMVSVGEEEFYDQMKQMMRDLDVLDHFQFIRWMGIDEMKELYSLADVTLCLGNIVEAFGNVAYESLACGTPSIVARVGVHRTLMPDDLIDKVHFGDIDDAANRIVEYVRGETPPWEDIRSFIQAELNYGKQIENYGRVIGQCQKRDSLKFSRLEVSSEKTYRLAPWCYIQGDRIYHDFRGCFEPAHTLVSFVKGKGQFSSHDASRVGIPHVLWDEWITRTYLVPVMG